MNQLDGLNQAVPHHRAYAQPLLGMAQLCCYSNILELQHKQTKPVG